MGNAVEGIKKLSAIISLITNELDVLQQLLKIVFNQ